MTSTYLEHSHVARVLFDASVVAFAGGEFWQTLRRRHGASRSSLLAELIFRAIFFAGIVALPLGKAMIPGADVGGVAIFASGAVVGWLGLMLRWWAFATLGSYFTTVVMTSADQPVIDRGPYRTLRHPSYTGLLIALSGCGLMLGNWAGAVVSFLLVLAALVYRLQREERAMSDAVGAAYDRFAASRARLIPFVW